MLYYTSSFGKCQLTAMLLVVIYAVNIITLIWSENMGGDIFKIIGDLGFPVAAALAGGYFVFLTIKLLLGGVLSAIKGMAGIITALDNRVKTMNHDVIRIDTVVSNALGLRPDVDRISRADGKNDARRD
jgi:archaellum biogenesis ATPase FlaH